MSAEMPFLAPTLWPAGAECQLQHRPMSARSMYDSAMQPAALQPTDLLKGPEAQASKQSETEPAKAESPWVHTMLRSVNLFKRKRKTLYADSLPCNCSEDFGDVDMV